MFKLLGRLVGLVIAIPLALVALVLYPVVWFILLPVRLVGGAVNGTLGVLRSFMGMPGKVMGRSGGDDAEG